MNVTSSAESHFETWVRTHQWLLWYTSFYNIRSYLSFCGFLNFRFPTYILLWSPFLSGYDPNVVVEKVGWPGQTEVRVKLMCYHLVDYFKSYSFPGLVGDSYIINNVVFWLWNHFWSDSIMDCCLVIFVIITLASQPI